MKEKIQTTLRSHSLVASQISLPRPPLRFPHYLPLSLRVWIRPAPHSPPPGFDPAHCACLSCNLKNKKLEK